MLFSQVRPGKHGKLFRMFKFRTMTNAKDVNGNLLPDADRLTPFGRFLRSTSLDELPELINVIRGEMSLVGPRPLLTEYLPLYSPEQNRRHEVKPGMTGWAQVNGRNAISWDEKFKLDVWYVDNRSLWLDIKILAITIRNVLLRKGINNNESETMPFFKGTANVKAKAKMKRLAILGASGHGKVTADAALLSGWGEVTFFDDAWPKLTMVGSWPVNGNSAMLLDYTAYIDGAIVAIGNNAIRLEKQKDLEDAGISVVTVIHPSATVSPFSEIGMGSVVFAGAVINAFARIGRSCIINTGSSIDHDCVLANGVHVSPGAHLGGGTHVGRASWIGIGAVVRQCIYIGENVMVGAGAAVVKDIGAGLTVVGVPACEIIMK